MVRTTGTPTAYSVYNELDRHGLLLGLPRLEQEKNAAYKRRLMDVFVHRASSTYQGLINGITRELGLSIIDTMSISPVVDSNGDPLLTSPAVVFQDTKCTLYSDYQNGTVLLDIDRYEPTGGSWTLGELRDTINNTGYFTASLETSAEAKKRSMTIFNQSSVVIVPAEELSGAGAVIVLENRNLLPGTVTVESDNLVRRVSSEANLRLPGDYTVNHTEGMIVALGAPAPGSFVRYSYRDDSFIAQSSPVILHNLQSDDFKTKMFEQVTNEDGDVSNGLPTILGADIINELMSVYPANWGE